MTAGLISEQASPRLTVAPGGDCLCGRGEAVGTLTYTSTRMHFRAFHDGPAAFHHEHTVDWACADCVAETAVAIASGQVREDMRRFARERSAVIADEARRAPANHPAPNSQ